MGAARMVGDTNLYKKMEQAEQDIKRDIVFAASLVRFCLYKEDLFDFFLMLFPLVFLNYSVTYKLFSIINLLLLLFIVIIGRITFCCFMLRIIKYLSCGNS